jgi:hypothetical protein
MQGIYPIKEAAVRRKQETASLNRVRGFKPLISPAKIAAIRHGAALSVSLISITVEI